MIIFSSVLVALDVLISGFYQKLKGKSFAAGLRFNFFVGLFSAVLFFIICGLRFEITVFSAVMALIMTTAAIAFFIMGFQILAEGKTAMYSFFRMTGSMLLPYIWGLFLLDEAFSWLRFAGLCLIVFSVFLMNSGDGKTSMKIKLMCFGVFVLAGFVSIVSKEHSISEQAVSPLGYVVLTSLAKVLICGPLMCFPVGKRDMPKEHTPKALLLCAVSAAVSGSAYIIQLFCAESMPASFLYPVITGGTILFSALFARIAAGEKMDKKSFIALFICFGGTCLFI